MFSRKVYIWCRECGKEIGIFLDPKDYEAFRNGRHVQDAFPYLTAAEREMFLTQICGACFDVMFPDEEDY